jgi:hypothetical protein
MYRFTTKDKAYLLHGSGESIHAGDNNSNNNINTYTIIDMQKILLFALHWVLICMIVYSQLEQQ